MHVRSAAPALGCPGPQKVGVDTGWPLRVPDRHVYAPVGVTALAGSQTLLPSAIPIGQDEEE